MKTICRANWRDLTEYPDPKTASANRWAWEFLRRNLDYEADWQRYASAMRAVASRVPEISQYVECLLADTLESWTQLRAAFTDDTAFAEQLTSLYARLSREDEMNVWDPPRLPGETISAYQNRVEKCMRRPLSRALGEKWGLAKIAQPANATYSIPQVVFLNAGVWGSYDSLDYRSYKGTASRKQWLQYCEWVIENLGSEFPHGGTERLLIAFDLRYPIEPQIAGAKAHLKDRQAKLKSDGAIDPQRAHSKRPDDWLNYLRALDAVANNVKVNDIVSALLPDDAWLNTLDNDYKPKKAVEKWLKTGEQLTRAAYKRIALIP